MEHVNPTDLVDDILSTHHRKNRKQMLSVMQDEKAFAAAVKQSLEPQRLRVRGVLTDEQYKRYEAYQKTVIQQAEMGRKMMGAMMQPKK